MVRHKRSGIAFWLFLVLLALGLGWAASQDWRWPSLALFDWQSEDEQTPAPEVVAEAPAAEQPATEEPAAAAVAEQAGPAASAEPPADAQADTSAGRRAQAEAGPAATDSAVPSEQAAREPGPEAGGDPTEQASEQAPQPGSADTAAADPSTVPPAADVAALEPAPDSAASQTDPQAATPGADGAVSEPAPAPGAQEQEQAHDTPPGAAQGTATMVVGSLDAAPPTAEGPVKPSFDLVRVGRDGRAVIAGRAAPGAEVEVRSGGQVIDRVRATRRGEWVAIPGLPLPPGDQELSAVATDGTTPVESEQVVVVAVPGPTAPTTAASTTAAAETSAAAEPVAVLLPRGGKGTGRILQAPGRLSAEGTLALMTVSYDESGEVLLSGEAPPGVPVRIYVDNRPAALVVGDAKGAWSSRLGETLAPGTYSLRLDQLDAEGQPVARIETPFTRVSEPPVEGDIQVDYVVVQPGNSLWRIARRLSGKGLDYVHIYDANQTQIRDPDLIYPGQVFEIPVAVGSAG